MSSASNCHATNLYVCVYESQRSYTCSYEFALITGNADSYNSLIQYDMHSFPVEGPLKKSGELPLMFYNTISRPPPQNILTLILIAEIKDKLLFEETINRFSLEVSTMEECEEDVDGSYELVDDDDYYGEEYYEGGFDGKLFFLKWAFRNLVWMNSGGKLLKFGKGSGWGVDEVVYAGTRFTDTVIENGTIGDGVVGYIIPVYDMADFPNFPYQPFTDCDGDWTSEIVDL